MLLAYERLGWKDIHATSQDQPNPFVAPRLREYMKRAKLYKMEVLFSVVTNKLKFDLYVRLRN